ncbi:MAG: SHOCT domain-containing protein [Candidatus Marinimicrobia bacterium]|nr:SHOCT domain-containing protein [Candidatus Neomarinimicrobiota bacterium]
MHQMWGPGWYGWIFWVVIIGLIIWAIIAMTNRGTREDHTVGGSESALDILKKRYAEGKISKEEFEEKKRDLES